jgi:hypothetical protein
VNGVLHRNTACSTYAGVVRETGLANMKIAVSNDEGATRCRRFCPLTLDRSLGLRSPAVISSGSSLQSAICDSIKDTKTCELQSSSVSSVAYAPFVTRLVGFLAAASLFVGVLLERKRGESNTTAFASAS